jgi:phospholipase/lecithinase/hemolysin
MKMSTRSWKVLVVVVMVSSVVLAPMAKASCFPAIFNFGDSTSDTGGIHASFPGSTPAEYSPYGMTYFGKPNVRYSDGRLLIDFLATGLGLNFLSPYLQSVNSNFQQGANFATAGATVQQVTYLSPFTLPYQIKQFNEFYANVQSVLSAGAGTDRLPTSMSIFSDALYTIAIGGNDFTYGYTRLGMGPSQVESYLPQVVSGVTNAIQDLYNHGARNFMVWDIEPQGCLPYMLTLIQHTASDLDANGCLYNYNNAATYYNGLLKTALTNLQGSLSGANVIYLGMYDIKYNLMTNLTQNGFVSGVKACCGVPSAFNYNTQVNCGSTGTVNGVYLAAQTCTNPAQYTVWDGVHNTDAGNHYLAHQIFSGNYFTPQFNQLVDGCDLSPF